MKNKKADGMNIGTYQNEIAGGKFQGFDVFNIAINEEKFQTNLAAHLARHKTVRRLVRCHGCNKSKSPLKMTVYATICRQCVQSLRTKGAAARNNFIERAKSNVGKFLRRVAG